MYSDKGLTLAAILEGFLSTCDEAQVLEAIQVLNDTISNLQNDNLTQEKAADSEQKKETYQTAKSTKKRLRGEKTPIDNNLAKRIYNAAKKRPKARQEDIEKSLKITKGIIGKQRKLLYFMGEYRTLANIFKLGQLMGGSNGRRYKREIAEDYEE